MPVPASHPVCPPSSAHDALTSNASASVDPLVCAAQTGDATAFAALYDAHAPRLFAVCVGLAGGREEAGELVQDTFVRAWERLGTFRGESAFSTWLHRVAVNIMLNEERTRRRRVQRVVIASELLPTARDADAPVADALASSESHAVALTVDVGLQLDLEAAIGRLPDGARRVYVLHDIAGYDHAEIAGQLGIAEGTSKSHLFRARRLLRGMLER